MISKELLEIIRCPESRQDLKLAPQDLLDRLNEQIRGRQLKNRAGTLVEQPLEGGLVRADGNVVYPIVDGIPLLLKDEGIATNAAWPS